MSDEKKDRIKSVLFWILSLGAVLCSAYLLLIDGTLAWHRQQKEFYMMMAETAVLFCLFCVIGMRIAAVTQRGKEGMRHKRALAVMYLSGGLVAAVFLWAHAILVPLLVSGLYLCYVILVGRFVRITVCKAEDEKTEKWRSDRLWMDLLLGAMTVIVVFCLMSALGAGAIMYLQLAVCVTMVLLAGWAGLRWKHRKTEGRQAAGLIDPISPFMVLSVSFILIMFCIQAGRMNTAVDFDSLWYGVRSPYILDNGSGIYENLGTIGIVYTYSKGFEVLTLPLSTLPSYSFVISTNLWFCAGALWIAWEVIRTFVDKRLALLMTVLLAASPGIMNMGITAKSDAATLLFQLVMLLFMIRYVEEDHHRLRNFVLGAGACFFTWTLKPTALVFSTAAAGMSLLFILWKRRFPVWNRQEHPFGSIGILILSLLTLAGIWARTVLITGLPVTSVFSSMMTKLGLRLKYPFQINEIPNEGAGKTLSEQAAALAKRLWGLLVSPNGEDMAHVILAWGGFLLLFFFLIWLLGTVCRKVKKDNGSLAASYLAVVYVPFLIVNLVSLSMLGQVDGNYFMFLYVFTGIVVFYQAGRLESEYVRRALAAASVPVVIYMTVVTALTNWDWGLGFTPVQLRHKGYYNHLELKREEMVDKGNGHIWDTLAADPENRVIAVGEHPEVLSFPCNVQSYDDITGYWGNVVLVKTMDNFVEFMTYAETDYIYVQSGYMKEDQRCYSLIRTLIEYGKLKTVCYEEGSLLATVLVEGVQSERSLADLEEFDSYYLK